MVSIVKGKMLQIWNKRSLYISKMKPNASSFIDLHMLSDTIT